MTTMAVLTPSYRPDLLGLLDLHKSILEHTSEDVIHHVIVPGGDFELFADIGRKLGSNRLVLWPESKFLPKFFFQTDLMASAVSRIPLLPAKARVKAINLKKPWPPIRGWILQQVIKLEAASQLDADVVAVIDSDVVMVGDFGASNFIHNGIVRTYSKADGVDDSLERHRYWIAAAQKMLGVPSVKSSKYADYIAGLVTWDPAVVRALLARIESVAGRDWQSVVAGQLHFSEFILYGVYLENFGTPIQLSSLESESLCHSYWATTPMDLASANKFIANMGPTDIAVHIQSASGTETAIRDYVLAEIRKR